jgi:hypothetical protein
LIKLLGLALGTNSQDFVANFIKADICQERWRHNFVANYIPFLEVNWGQNVRVL